MKNYLSRVVPALAAVGVAPAGAEERAALVNAGGSSELLSAGYLAQVLGSLVLVFLCLFGVVYLLRRMGGVRVGAGAPLRVLGSASVGQREKVVLLEAGTEQILIGVAQGSVRTLHVFDEPISVADSEAPMAPDFAAVLRSVNPLGGRS